MKISADGKREGSEDTAACVFGEACTPATGATGPVIQNEPDEPVWITRSAGAA